jgi:hypothetical protein
VLFLLFFLVASKSEFACFPSRLIFVSVPAWVFPCAQSVGQLGFSVRSPDRRQCLDLRVCCRLDFLQVEAFLVFTLVFFVGSSFCHPAVGLAPRSALSFGASIQSPSTGRIGSVAAGIRIPLTILAACGSSRSWLIQRAVWICRRFLLDSLARVHVSVFATAGRFCARRLLSFLPPVTASCLAFLGESPGGNTPGSLMFSAPTAALPRWEFRCQDFGSCMDMLHWISVFPHDLLSLDYGFRFWPRATVLVPALFGQGFPRIFVVVCKSSARCDSDFPARPLGLACSVPSRALILPSIWWFFLVDTICLMKCLQGSRKLCQSSVLVWILIYVSRSYSWVVGSEVEFSQLSSFLCRWFLGHARKVFSKMCIRHWVILLVQFYLL